MEIFMALKDGCVTDLVEDRPKPRLLARDILVQMLRALAYLDSRELIHRDVKPENILYSCREDGKHQFFLADFGVSNWVKDSSTCCGTPLFRAPEIWKHEEQSPKVDVWALFVTFLWVANIRGFRTGAPTGFGPYIWAKVQSVGYLKGISKTVSMLRDMGAEDPELRPSASEALDLLEESE
jgi:serine/threonine protein kinase